ncbi:MAG TPA: phosphatase PAP2 family protein [Streptosporangiaceae bacterium]|nr:phosphatase PAP2 family protein [Streptosporangiaceae bacterium]
MTVGTCAEPGVRVGGPRWRFSGQRAALLQDREGQAHALLAFSAFAILAAQPHDGWLGDIDQALSARVAATRTATAVRVSKAASAAAEPSLAAIPLAASAAVASRLRGWPAAIGPCLTVLAGMAVRRVLSQAIARPRPPAEIWLAEPSGASLPSRHTCLAALIAGTCASALGAGRASSQAAAMLAAAGVGASRVYLGVHWPTDVLAGWLFAAGWLSLAELALPSGARLVPSPPPAGMLVRRWRQR